MTRLVSGILLACAGTSAFPSRCRNMQSSKKTDVVRQEDLRELVDLEVADIVATANEQGYSSEEVLAALTASVAASSDALEQDPDPAAEPLVALEKTTGSGALPDSTSAEVDPGVE